MNNDAQFDRERQLFEQALEQPAGAERLRFLKEACGADTVLLVRLQDLLRAHEQDRGFLTGNPPAARDTQVLPGMVIGRYKPLQELGEGGCGIVYMAQQEEPVRRQVALKLIKPGMDSKSVIARFEAERQALALMEHPNIAQVFDAGTTGTGRPFFVMEWVRGVPITDYCDAHGLAMEDRLDLFVQVCRAVQHAHQKGIIHRDLKPSNILVTEKDGAPVPKVIDFGIAKATTGQALTNKTIFTAFEQFLGTPAYMSPEQTALTSLDIDTRTDIYSLGVLLYELLTGRPPFDPKELMQAGFDEMRRTIRETEPARPSMKLAALLAEELTKTAKRRHTDPPRLIHLVRGDLDWIVMKCLEKDRARRYETANGLAVEIGRFLNNEPVVARPPSKLYRFQKMARRNKHLFAAAAAGGLALALGVTTLAYRGALITNNDNYAKIVAPFLGEQLGRLSESLTNLAADGDFRDAMTNIVLPLYDNSRPAANNDVRAALTGVHSNWFHTNQVFEVLGKWGVPGGEKVAQNWVAMTLDGRLIARYPLATNGHMVMNRSWRDYVAGALILTNRPGAVYCSRIYQSVEDGRWKFGITTVVWDGSRPAGLLTLMINSGSAEERLHLPPIDQKIEVLGLLDRTNAGGSLPTNGLYHAFLRSDVANGGQPIGPYRLNGVTGKTIPGTHYMVVVKSPALPWAWLSFVALVARVIASGVGLLVRTFWHHYRRRA
jgi:serine/threonine protein kinase